MQIKRHLHRCGYDYDLQTRWPLYYLTSNEVRDLEADLLDLVCNDVETEPVLQEITRETLNSGANLACDAHLDIHARGF